MGWSGPVRSATCRASQVRVGAIPYGVGSVENVGDGDAQLSAEALELAALLHDFGARWHVYRAVRDGAVGWEADVRPVPADGPGPVIRKATIQEMRAALEILDGRRR
jgi:hypothetical protein